MVQNPGKTLCADTLKPVNEPEPVLVAEDSAGLPVAVKTVRKHAVKAIEDRWRLDDEWWRSKEVSRLYYDILLTSGQRLVLYKDLTDGCWYRQEY